MDLDKYTFSNKKKIKKVDNEYIDWIKSYISTNTNSFNTIKEIISETDDIFNPNKLNRTYLSGRYIIRNTNKLKNVFSGDFDTINQDLFGVLDVNINIILNKNTDEFKSINDNVFNYAFSALTYIDNQNPGSSKYLYKSSRSYGYNPDIDINEALIPRIHNNHVKLYIADTLTTGTVPPATLDKDVEAFDYYQAIVATYTFYASNGSTYHANIKIDDIPIIILSNEGEGRVGAEKYIYGARPLYINEKGELYSNREEKDWTIPYIMNTNKLKSMKILFRIDTNTYNDYNEHFYRFKDLKKELLQVKPRADSYDDIYNFDPDYIITRAVYLSEDMRLWIDPTRLERQVSNNIHGSSISGIQDKTTKAGAPTTNDTILVSYFNNDVGGTYSSFTDSVNIGFSENNRLKATGTNVYYFHNDMFSVADDANGMPQGFFFRVELRGNAIKNRDPSKLKNTTFTNIGVMNVSTTTPTGTTLNYTYNRYRNAKDTSLLTADIYDEIDHDKSLQVGYPCVDWYSFAWNTRSFSIQSTQERHFRYKYIQAKLAQPVLDFLKLSSNKLSTLQYEHALSSSNEMTYRYIRQSGFSKTIALHGKNYHFLRTSIDYNTNSNTMYIDERRITNWLFIDLSK